MSHGLSLVDELFLLAGGCVGNSLAVAWLAPEALPEELAGVGSMLSLMLSLMLWLWPLAAVVAIVYWLRGSGPEVSRDD